MWRHKTTTGGCKSAMTMNINKPLIIVFRLSFVLELVFY